MRFRTHSDIFLPHENVNLCFYVRRSEIRLLRIDMSGAKSAKDSSLLVGQHDDNWDREPARVIFAAYKILVLQELF